MFVTCVHIVVKPESREAFIEATLANVAESVKEPENLSFHFLEKPEEPTQFMLYEAYRSEEGALAHKKTPHYLKWRETVADHMAEPRKGIRYDGVS